MDVCERVSCNTTLVSCRVGLISEGTVFVLIQEDIRSPYGTAYLCAIEKGSQGRVVCNPRAAGPASRSEGQRAPALGDGVSRTLLLDRMRMPYEEIDSSHARSFETFPWYIRAAAPWGSVWFEPNCSLSA